VNLSRRGRGEPADELAIAHSRNPSREGDYSLGA
jgi:hypothetical protein